jgi:hypothetical protein
MPAARKTGGIKEFNFKFVVDYRILKLFNFYEPSH